MSGAPSDATALTSAEFEAVRNYVYERSGLYFADSKKFILESRLQRRFQAVGTSSVVEYMALLKSPVSGSRELLELLDVVTTHETSFFRNPLQIDTFRHHVVPALVQRAREVGSRSLKIWSAACSSGEEPYTLAIVFLEELGADARRWDLRIVATDVARSVLDKALAGVYGHHSFRNTPAYYIQKYFDAVGPDAFRLKGEVRQLVSFHLLNFADDARMRAMGSFQTVFCRNALIYFDRVAQRRVVAHLAHALDPGGYLFLGHAETLHGVSNDFRIAQYPNGLVYQRPPIGADRRSETCNRIA